MVESAAHRDEAIRLMAAFAERTGLTSSKRNPQRYLWTDAFAVCNFLGLASLTGESRYTELALKLVKQVHETLGRHRPDDARAGWLSGLDDESGAAHPTLGGLRIGKKLPERRHEEPLDERLEWDRDGQYFHYLTKWMHALDQVARATGQALFNLWARELAHVALERFLAPEPGGGLHLAWKMSIDLSRPLVPAMGQHDPLDGLITCAELQSTASRVGDGRKGPDLEVAAGTFASMIDASGFATADPLGIGGLLVDAWRVEQLPRVGAVPKEDLVGALLEAALAGLTHYARLGELRRPAGMRLAFRELGLAIGLAAVERLEATERTSPILGALRRHLPIGAAIEAFWREGKHRADQGFASHLDISEVMLATRLVPQGFLEF